MASLRHPNVVRATSWSAQATACVKESGASRSLHCGSYRLNRSSPAAQVLFLGVCFKPPAMLTEFCARGSLLDILRKGLRDQVSFRLACLHDVAAILLCHHRLECTGCALSHLRCIGRCKLELPLNSGGRSGHHG